MPQPHSNDEQFSTRVRVRRADDLSSGEWRNGQILSHGLVTLSTTVSLASTVVPGAGSILTTVQLAGTNTFWYFGVAEASSTLLNPIALSLFSAILAFCPVKSGIVRGPDAAGAVVDDDGALAVHDGTLGSDFVTVTVEGGLDVVPPQAATVSAIAHAAAANWVIFRITVAKRITAGSGHGRD